MGASVLSIAGTEMAQFAVIAWAWHHTGSVSATGLVTVASFMSVVLVSIFSGALVDRWNRKLTIIATDLMGAVASAVILLLFLADNLQIWHLVILGVILGVLEAFQFPAYFASITQLVPQEQRAKANSLFQTSWSLAEIISAALAGVLFVTIGLEGILIIDLFSFALIIGAVAFLRIPQPEKTEETPSSLITDVKEGFSYLFGKPSVLWTVLIFTSINVAYGAYQGVFRPMILSLTANREDILGLALAAVSVGSVVGGIFMTMWRVPKNRIPTILIAWSVMASFGFVLAALGRSLPIWLIGRFCAGFLSNIAMSLSFALWQDKVDESIQGRVFGIIRLLVQVSIPISAFVAALLADYLVEPAIQPGGSLAVLFGWLVGTGKGAGMSLILMTAGVIFGVAFPLLGFLLPAIRNADKREGAPAPVPPALADAEIGIPQQELSHS
jgi:MFS transporter, DHA3 family, macrolide efflux protein